MVVIRKACFLTSIPEKKKHEYQEHDSSLENKAIAVGGDVRFSTWITAYSPYLETLLEKAKKGNFKDAGTIHFNGEKGSTPFSFQTLKNFFDILHDVPDVDLDLLQIIDLIKFLHDDGKLISEFERKLQEYLITKLLEMNNTNDTKLLICVYLSKFQNPDPDFEKEFVDEIEWEELKVLVWDWDRSDATNRSLVELITGMKCTKESKDEIENAIDQEVLMYSAVKLKKYYEELTVVSPSNTAIQGAYFYRGQHNDKPYYKHYDEQRYIFHSGTAWLIGFDKDQDRRWAKNETEIDKPLLSSGWSTNSGENNAWTADEDFKVSQQGGLIPTDEAESKRSSG